MSALKQSVASAMHRNRSEISDGERIYKSHLNNSVN